MAAASDGQATVCQYTLADFASAEPRGHALCGVRLPAVCASRLKRWGGHASHGYGGACVRACVRARTSTLDDGLRAAQHHLAARHDVGDGIVLDHDHRHARRRQLLGRGVAVAVWMRLGHHHAEVPRLGGREEERDDDARVAVRQHDGAVEREHVHAELRYLRASLDARLRKHLTALDQQPLDVVKVLCVDLRIGNACRRRGMGAPSERCESGLGSES